uniref:Uncharacterized protein n=1 Tax=Escherichia coli TaxID=562 RepID=A0A2R2ZJF9_ECOLX|nr:hypothetical protein [Escherichia coli]WBW56322.1 hypothetical protein MLIPGIGO_00072 [Escherichia coli]
MEAPAEVEWSTAGKWRRRPAQPAAVLTGSASPTPFPAKLYPLKTAQMPLYAVGVVPARRQAAVGAYLRVSGPLGPLTSVYPRTYRDTTHRDDEE